MIERGAAALHAGRRADLPLPAALRLLLEPARLGAATRDELDTEAWLRVLREAEALGVVQVHLTGGEPLLRDDLEALVAEAQRARALHQPDHERHPAHARAAGAAARAAGLDNVQVSVQDVDRAGVRPHRRAALVRAQAARSPRWVKELGLPLTLNVVLHRDNLDHVAEIIALAERSAADRLELANTQYLGWALVNRAAPCCRPASSSSGRASVAARRAPPPDADGWRSCSSRPTTTPSSRRRAWTAGAGASSSSRPTASRCRATRRTRCRAWSSTTCASARSARSGATRPASHAFRGEAWMPEPCRSCDAPRPRLRRLPLPGLPPHGRRGGHRSRVLALAAARADRDRASHDGRARRRADLPVAASASRTG